MFVFSQNLIPSLYFFLTVRFQKMPYDVIRNMPPDKLKITLGNGYIEITEQQALR